MPAGTNIKSIANHTTRNEPGGYPSEISNPKSSIPAAGRLIVCPSEISNLKSRIPAVGQRFIAPTPVPGPCNIKKTERTHRAYTSIRHNSSLLADLLPGCLADFWKKRTHQTHHEARSHAPISRGAISHPSSFITHPPFISYLSWVHPIFRGEMHE